MGTEGEGKKTPTVLWAQRADVVFLTIEVPDVDKESAVVKVVDGGTRVLFDAESKSYGGYKLELTLLNEVDETSSKITIGDRSIVLVLAKKDTNGDFWSRLTKDKSKLSYLKVDWNKWKDEDDEDDDLGGAGDFDLGQLESLSNFRQDNSYKDFMPPTEDDSDDDDIEDDMPELVPPK